MAPSAAKVTLVVPCYNEEVRLPVADYIGYAKASGTSNRAATRLLFVDDGSRDRTVDVLQCIIDGSPAGCVNMLKLPSNQGKAEAVRQGLLQAVASSSDGDIVGFWDSDLATPLAAVEQLAELLRSRPQLQMVFAARVALLGRKVKRSPIRHYIGRVFATLASLALNLAIYDTQCGAKLFRVTPTLRAVLAAPFMTRWVFDCEMIARFAALSAASASQPPLEETIYEYPIEEWVDVAGSKVKPTDVVRMAIGLVRIHVVYFLHEWPGGAARPALVRTVMALAVGILVLGALLLLIAYALLTLINH